MSHTFVLLLWIAFNNSSMPVSDTHLATIDDFRDADMCLVALNKIRAATNNSINGMCIGRNQK